MKGIIGIYQSPLFKIKKGIKVNVTKADVLTSSFDFDPNWQFYFIEPKKRKNYGGQSKLIAEPITGFGDKLFNLPQHKDKIQFTQTNETQPTKVQAFVNKSATKSVSETIQFPKTQAVI